MTKIVKGTVVKDDVFSAIWDEGAQYVRSSLISGFWHVIFTLLASIASRQSDNIIRIILWVIVIAICIKLRIIFIKTFNGLKWFIISILVQLKKPIFWVIFAALIALQIQIGNIKIDIEDMKGEIAGIKIDIEIIQNTLANVVDRVGKLENNVEILFTEVKRLDKGLESVQQVIDEYIYTPSIEKLPFFKQLDEFVLNNIIAVLTRKKGNINLRQILGLGCFIKGTKIQIDKDGHTVNIEELRNGDYVYNPILDKQINIHTVIHGPEDGHLYNISTNDGLSVIVTDTHPILLCETDIDGVILSCDYNVAAHNVWKGNYTLTTNGYQKIIDIMTIPAKNAVVFNFKLDLPADIIDAERAIIADGVVTLDLTAQQRHH